MATKSEMQNFYRTAVKASLGIDANIDDEGDVTFEVPSQGTFYILLEAQEDPEYFMLVYPNFFAITKENHLAALAAINTVNSKNKAVKLSFQEKEHAGSVKASAEMFIAAPNDMPDKKLVVQILNRTVNAIINGVKSFVQEMPHSSTTNSEHHKAPKRL
jgi:hypothetical protein